MTEQPKSHEPAGKRESITDRPRPPAPEAPPPHSSDPYEITAEAIADPPHTFWGSLRQIGPGLILTASIVGTGELIATTNLGAKAGFALLWLVILSCFIKVFVQIELGRHTIASGETTLASFERVPGVGRALPWWWLAMMLLSQFQIGAMIGGIAQALHLMLPGFTEWLAGRVAPLSANAATSITRSPEIPWAFLVTAVTCYLLVRGRYHVVERWSTWMVAVFTLLTVLCMVWLPFTDPSHIPVRAPAEAGDPVATLLLAAFAMIGTTGVGASELIAYPYWCLEKRYARYVGPREESASWLRRARGWLRVMQVDAWFSMVIYTLATLAFYVLGAGVLYRHTHGQGLSDSTGQMLAELATMYEPILGRTGALWFICIGGFAVLYSTLFAATAGNSRVTTDFLRVKRLVPFTPQDYRIRWVRLFSGWLPVLGLVLFLFLGSPVSMVIIGGVAQALTLPMIGGVAVYLRLRSTDPRLVARGWWDVCLWASVATFTAAAAYLVWSQWANVQALLRG